MKYPKGEEKIYIAGRDEGEFPNLVEFPNLPKNKSSNRPSSSPTKEKATSDSQKQK